MAYRSTRQQAPVGGIAGSALIALAALLLAPMARAGQENLPTAPDRIEWDAGGLYDGRFDDGSAFQIELAYPRPAQAGAHVQAAWNGYRYPARTSGAPILLSAAPVAAGSAAAADGDASGSARTSDSGINRTDASLSDVANDSANDIANDIANDSANTGANTGANINASANDGARADATVNTITLLRMAENGTVLEQFSLHLSNDRSSGNGYWRAAPAGTGAGLTRGLTLRCKLLYREAAVMRAAPPPAAEATAAEARAAAARVSRPRPPFVFSALYPQLPDGPARAWIQDRVGRCDAVTECINSVRVAWYSPSLLSLDASNYSYSAPQAHGSTVTRIGHFRIAEGKLMPVGLDHFLVPSAACRDRTSALIVARLGERHLQGAADGTLAKHPDINFLALPQGLAVRFEQYAVGAYVQGMPSVMLTRADLGDCLRGLPAE